MYCTIFFVWAVLGPAHGQTGDGDGGTRHGRTVSSYSSPPSQPYTRTAVLCTHSFVSMAQKAEEKTLVLSARGGDLAAVEGLLASGKDVVRWNLNIFLYIQNVLLFHY